MKQRLSIFLIWGLFILFSTFILLQGPKVQSDLGQFLPKSSSGGPDLLLDTLRDGPTSRVILLDLSGAPAQQLAKTAKELAEVLAATPHFQHILGADNSLPDTELKLLFRYRYLLNSGHFDTDALKKSLQQRLKEIAIGTPLDRQQLRNDPTALNRQTLQRLINHNGPQRHLGTWFSDDHEHALLLLHSAAPAFSLDEQEHAIEAIYSTFSQLTAPNIQLVMSGPPLFAVESRKQIRKGSQELSILASLGVILLLLFAYRSISATVLVVLPLFSGMLAGAATVVILFGQLHGIALAFGITLIGITVDYPIHLFSHGGHRNAAARIWPTLRLGMLTSVLGFSALLLSNFQGLAQMGLFAISGIVVAALVTRWVIPAMLTTEYQLHPSLTRPIQLTLSGAQHFNFRWLAPLLLIISLGYVSQQGEELWESRLSRLSPISPAQIELDHQLRQRLHAAEPGQLLLLQNKNLENLLQHAEVVTQRLEEAQQNGVLDNFDTPTRYLPSKKSQLQNREALPENKTLVEALASASEGLPFRDNLFQPFLDDIKSANRLPPLTIESLAGTVTGVRLGTLLRQYEGGWYALITLGGMHDQEAITHIASTSDARYINISQQSAALVAQYRDEALQLIGVGVILIILILTFSLRSLTRVTHVALPVFTAIAVTTLILNLLGERLSLFHLASLLLVLGIGLDYGLFFDRCRMNNDGCIKTVGALLICSSTTLLVFGLLTLSPLPVLHAIGLTVSLGVLSSLLLTLAIGGAKTEIMV